MTTTIHPDRLALTCAALQGLLGSDADSYEYEGGLAGCAEAAARFADAALAELRRTEPQPEPAPQTEDDKQVYAEWAGTPAAELARLRAVEEAYKRLCARIIEADVRCAKEDETPDADEWESIVHLAQTGTP